MKHLLAFLIWSIPIVYLSRKVIFKPAAHGFYRFIAWELMALMLVYRYGVWFAEPFSWHQVASWLLLFGSIPVALLGLTEFSKKGKQIKNHVQTELYGFEKTSVIVSSGIYRFIRHPMYTSLMMLNWGIFLKKPDLLFFAIALLATFFLVLTSLRDEKECINYFGQPYQAYMKKTKRFIPLVL